MLLREHSEQHQQYNECRNINAALCNQLITEFEDTYFSSLRNAFDGYSRATTLHLIIHIYNNYTRILSTDLTENDKNMREPYNLNNPIKSLYTRLNNCVNYSTAVGEQITEDQVICISDGLVAETGQFQEDFWTWCAKLYIEKTWTTFQAHFIKA